MNWRDFWKKGVGSSNLLHQVQRTNQGKELSQSDLDAYVAHVKQQCEFCEGDRLLDICCGNGLVTAQLASYVNNTVGIDFTREFIITANQRFSTDSLAFYEDDAMEMSSVASEKFDVVTCLFSIQYFSSEELKGILGRVVHMLTNNGRIFLGDIPDKKRQDRFSGKGFRKFVYYLKYWVGKDPTGKFWSKKELDKICRELGMKGKLIEQPAHLPYAHYRFDYLITKN